MTGSGADGGAAENGRHPDPAALARLAAGGLRGRVLVDVLQHITGCPQCGTHLGIDRSIGSGPRTGAGSPRERERGYEDIVERAVRRTRLVARRLDRERAAAARGVAALGALPLEDRRRALRTVPSFQSYAVAREALAWSAESRTEDASAAEGFAALALEVAEALSPRRYGGSTLEDLRSEAWAAVGNARRIRSDLDGAEEAFREALGHAEAGSGDPLEGVELNALYATFLRDSARHDAARERYELALGFCRDLRDRHLEGRIWLSLAILERAAGRSEHGLAILERAPRLLDPGREPRLLLAARQNRALLLADLGDAEGALRSYDGGGIEVAPGRLDRLRTLWLRALLLFRTGRVAEACSCLTRARAGFVRAAIPVDVALIDLDLARLSLEDGDREEARRRAADAFPAFVRRQLAPHVLRTLEIFRAASG